MLNKKQLFFAEMIEASSFSFIYFKGKPKPDSCCHHVLPVLIGLRGGVSGWCLGYLQMGSQVSKGGMISNSQQNKRWGGGMGGGTGRDGGGKGGGMTGWWRAGWMDGGMGWGMGNCCSCWVRRELNTHLEASFTHWPVNYSALLQGLQSSHTYTDSAAAAGVFHSCPWAASFCSC